VTRVLYFSDIHIEIREKAGRLGWTAEYPLDLGPDLRDHAGQVELLVLAGDIGRMRSRRDVSTLRYAEQAAQLLGCPVLVVPGNHEYYRAPFEAEREALLAAKLDGVTVLDRGEARYDVSAGALRVLGATLWTDYAALGDAQQGMRDARVIEDHRLITRADGSPFLPEHALAEHRLSRVWLAARLAEPHDGPTLVVTHHVPHSAAHHPGFGITPLSPAFHSDCDELIDAAARAGTAAWIFGHHHWSHELELRGLRLVSAQTGYPDEQTGWQGPGLLSI